MGGRFDVAVILGKFGRWHNVALKGGRSNVVLSGEMVGNRGRFRRGPYFFINLRNHITSFKLGLDRQWIFLGWQAAILGSCFFPLFLDVAWNLSGGWSVNPTIG